MRFPLRTVVLVLLAHPAEGFAFYLSFEVLRFALLLLLLILLHLLLLLEYDFGGLQILLLIGGVDPAKKQVLAEALLTVANHFEG